MSNYAIRAPLIIVALGFAILNSPAGHAAEMGKQQTAVIVDGQRIENLKAVAYQVFKPKQDVRNMGLERLRNAKLTTWRVRGRIIVDSESDLMTELQNEAARFDVELVTSGQSPGSAKKTVFRECRIVQREFQADSRGNNSTIYVFISDR